MTFQTKIDYSEENSREEIRPEMRRSWNKFCRELIQRRMSRDRMWAQLYLFEQWIWLEGRRYSMSVSTDKRTNDYINSWTGSFYPSNCKNFFIFTNAIRISEHDPYIKISGEIGMDGKPYLKLLELQCAIDELIVQKIIEQ